MAKCHGCNKRIMGGTHCKACVRNAGGYTSNIAAQLAEQQRKEATKKAAAAAARAKQKADSQARKQEVADRAKKMRAGKGQPTKEQISAARQISNVRGRPAPQDPKKKGWW